MLIYEYKLDGTKQQYVAIEEAIRVVQFIRNTCLRKWMDERGPRDTQRDMSNRAEMWKVDDDGEPFILWHTERALR